MNKDNDFSTGMGVIGGLPRSAFTIQSISPEILAVFLTIPLMIMLCLAVKNISPIEFCTSLMVIYLAMVVYSYAFCFFPVPIIAGTVIGLCVVISALPSVAVREWQLYDAAYRQDQVCKQSQAPRLYPGSDIYQQQDYWLPICNKTPVQEFCRFDTPYVEQLSKEIHPEPLPRICSTFVAPGLKAGDTRFTFFGGENDL